MLTGGRRHYLHPTDRKSFPERHIQSAERGQSTPESLQRRRPTWGRGRRSEGAGVGEPRAAARSLGQAQLCCPPGLHAHGHADGLGSALPSPLSLAVTAHALPQPWPSGRYCPRQASHPTAVPGGLLTPTPVCPVFSAPSKRIHAEGSRGCLCASDRETEAQKGAGAGHRHMELVIVTVRTQPPQTFLKGWGRGTESTMRSHSSF